MTGISITLTFLGAVLLSCVFYEVSDRGKMHSYHVYLSLVCLALIAAGIAVG